MAIRYTTESLQYQEFRIAIRSKDKGLYLARVEASPVGDSSDFTFRLPMAQGEIDEALATISNAGQRPLKRSIGYGSYDSISSIGSALQTALFEGTPLGRQFRAALEMTDRRREALRLRFLLQDPDVVNVPWEFLFDTYQSNYLALSTRTPIVRQGQAQLLTLSPLTPPLRILLVTADIANLLAAPEVELLQELASATGMVELQVVKDATSAALRDALRATSYHALYLIGAAAWKYRQGNRWDSARPTELRNVQNGLLLLGAKQSGKDPVADATFLSAAELQKLLAPQKELRLLILSGADTDLLAAEMAQSLSAVLGMRGLLAAATRLPLMQNFCNALLAGQPLEAALTQGRQLIDSQNPGVGEWGLPLLYENTQDGLFFTPAPAQQEASVKSATRSAAPATQPNPANQQEWQRLNSLIDIEERNLASLYAQRDALGDLLPKFTQQQIAESEKWLAQLQADLETIQKKG
ncbi:MAG: CHAT domain-containing protein [Caldilineaceae bacterium]